MGVTSKTPLEWKGGKQGARLHSQQRAEPQSLFDVCKHAKDQTYLWSTWNCKARMESHKNNLVRGTSCSSYFWMWWEHCENSLCHHSVAYCIPRPCCNRNAEVSGAKKACHFVIITPKETLPPPSCDEGRASNTSRGAKQHPATDREVLAQTWRTAKLKAASTAFFPLLPPKKLS